MQRRIDLLGRPYRVTVSGRPGQRRLQVDDGEPLLAAMTVEGENRRTVSIDGRQAEMHVAVNGETVHIRAFDRNFVLRIVDPVAPSEAGGGQRMARAPMPGTVVESHVACGDRVVRGRPLITIESMKILTVIAAPRDGEVFRVHFAPGETFPKNAVLVTLT